jgi:hypothetical protein
MGLSARHEQGLRKNNPAENSHQPTDDASVRRSASRALPLRKIPLSPRRGLRQFQCPTPSHVSSITPRATHCGDEHMARGRRGSLKFRRVENLRALLWAA